MTNQKKCLLNTLSHKLIPGFFVFCLAVVAGTFGCSDSGGKSKTGYHLRGYDGVISEQSSAQQSIVSATGNANLDFYAGFPWFVNLTFQVFDENQWGNADLTVDNFTVLEDGVEVSKLVSEMNIRKRDALPSTHTYGFKTLIFLDNTPSSSVDVEKMVECAQVVVDNIDEKGQQEIAIVAYDETGEAEVVEDFTDNVSDLTIALSPSDGIQPSYGTTNFYSGVISSLALWKDNHSPESLDFQQGVLVAVTDGKDTTSLSNVDDAIAARGDKQVIVVAVGNDIPNFILNDLERLGNAGFYHVTDPLTEPDPNFDKTENLCETMLEVQKQMMAYADAFYWLQYKTLITSKVVNSNHTVILSVVDNGNSDTDSQISGTYSSDDLFSGDPSIYFDTSASEPDGISEKEIVIERGQGSDEVTETIQAITYISSGSSPSQYEWSSNKSSVATVEPDSADSANAIITVVGPGDAVLTVRDTVNNIIQTLPVTVKVREESFEMIKHTVTSKAPWFADATFQVRNTYDEDDYHEDNPWMNQWNWISDLAREDFTVLENGTEIDLENSESHVRKRDNIPADYKYTLKTVLLIDNSPSARANDNLDLIKEAAKAFAKRALINDPSDNSDLGPLLDDEENFQQEIAIFSFDQYGDKLLVQDFTSDLETINEAIDNIVKGFQPISFYGSIIESLNLWDNDQLPYDDNTDLIQGVLIILSDGWDSNEGFYTRDAVMAETGDKQIICVGVGDDLVSTGNDEDLIAFGNGGFYSVPDPGQTIEVTIVSDKGDQKKATEVTYTSLEKTLMDIQDNNVHPYANSFYWLDYKSSLSPAPDCRRDESMLITINNNSNTGTGYSVWGKFDSCEYFEGLDGAIYVNSTVTNPDGLEGEINLTYAMLGDMLLDEPILSLEAFTYDIDGVINTPNYQWLSSNENIFQIVVDHSSYGNSRATLKLSESKQPGSGTLRVTDLGNGNVFRIFNVNVEEVEIPFTPVLYYPFDGNADDATGNGYDGEVHGAILTNDRYGKPGSAYSFSGINNYIAITDFHYGAGADAYEESIDSITVSAWVQSTSIQRQIIISFDRSEYFRLSWVDDIATSTSLGWDTAEASDNYDNLYALNNYTDGEWHFVCATYDKNLASDNKKLYIDGQLVASNSAHPDVGLGSSMTRYGFVGVGSEAKRANGDKNPLHYFEGKIDEVAIFSEALEPSQVTLLYNSTK